MKTTSVALLLLTLFVGWTHAFNPVDYGIVVIAWLSTAHAWFRAGVKTMEYRFLRELGDIIKEYIE